MKTSDDSNSTFCTFGCVQRAHLNIYTTFMGSQFGEFNHLLHNHKLSSFSTFDLKELNRKPTSNW